MGVSGYHYFWKHPELSLILSPLQMMLNKKTLQKDPQSVTFYRKLGDLELTLVIFDPTWVQPVKLTVLSLKWMVGILSRFLLGQTAYFQGRLLVVSGSV